MPRPALGSWLLAVACGTALAAACGGADSHRADRDMFDDVHGGAGGETTAGTAGGWGGEVEAGAAGGGGDGVDGAEGGSAGQGGSSPGEGGQLGSGGVPPVEVFELGNIATGESLCGVGFDHVAELVWVLPCSGASLLSYSRDGTPGPTVARGGEATNDTDVDVAPVAFTLGETAIDAGTLLHINGETGVAEIYALDQSGQSQAPLASLVTTFGNSHVVGGGYHAQRATFFLVQDRLGGTTAANTIAEIDAQSGAVLASFSTLPSLDVNYGDLDVCQSSGHLFVISSQENALAELTPDGTLVAKYPAPFASVSGIAFDDATGEAWASGTNGTLSRLGGMPCAPYEP